VQGFCWLQLKVIIRNRTDFSTFSNYQSKIQDIFLDPWYPKYFPNTVNAQYSCSQHVKVQYKSHREKNFRVKVLKTRMLQTRITFLSLSGIKSFAVDELKISADRRRWLCETNKNVSP
jgi:hypothetical protein